MAVAAHCVRCGQDFETTEAYTAHLNACSKPVAWQEPRFRLIRSEEPTTAEEPRFAPSTFDFGDDPRVAAETQRERVDGALRSGRIPSEVWEPEPERQPNIWRRIWQAITGQ